MDTAGQIRLNAMQDEYLDRNRAVKKALDNGVKFPRDTLTNFLQNGSRIVDLCRRGNANSAVIDHREVKLASAWKAVKEHMDGRKSTAGPKKILNAVQDGTLKHKPVLGARSGQKDTQDNHMCQNSPEMIKFHNATDTWNLNLDSLPVKKEIVTSNGIKFKVRDISNFCDCQAHDVWHMQGLEYLAACGEASKEIPMEYQVPATIWLNRI